MIRLILPLIYTGLMFLSAGCLEKSATPDQEANAIRLVRELTNQAIANQDVNALASAWMDNFLLISSRDNQVTGREENRKLFAEEFNTKVDVVYIRTPSEIKVMKAWDMASEYGNWIGRWKVGEAQIEIGGSYFAKWHKVNDAWLLRAEIFTPLHCQGGTYCDQKPN